MPIFPGTTHRGFAVKARHGQGTCPRCRARNSRCAGENQQVTGFSMQIRAGSFQERPFRCAGSLYLPSESGRIPDHERLGYAVSGRTFRNRAASNGKRTRDDDKVLGMGGPAWRDRRALGGGGRGVRRYRRYGPDPLVIRAGGGAGRGGRLRGRDPGPRRTRAGRVRECGCAEHAGLRPPQARPGGDRLRLLRESARHRAPAPRGQRVPGRALPGDGGAGQRPRSGSACSRAPARPAARSATSSRRRSTPTRPRAVSSSPTP